LVVAVLLTAGADANKVDNEGRKPLEVVMKGRCPHHSNYSCNCGRSPNLPLSALRLLRQHTFA
jgi:hypothetical protein